MENCEETGTWESLHGDWADFIHKVGLNQMKLAKMIGIDGKNRWGRKQQTRLSSAWKKGDLTNQRGDLNIKSAIGSPQ